MVIKQIASDIKQYVIENLDTLLLQFEENITNNGAEVIWAETANDAVAFIQSVIETASAEYVVKTKSITPEEIHLNEALEAAGTKLIETDLGEYIVQIAGEKPYHIVTPVMHKSRKDIAVLFFEKFDTSADSSPEFFTSYVREKPREKFINAEIGISGANFLIADTGSVCLTTNEGNGLLAT